MILAATLAGPASGLATALAGAANALPPLAAACAALDILIAAGILLAALAANKGVPAHVVKGNAANPNKAKSKGLVVNSAIVPTVDSAISGTHEPLTCSLPIIGLVLMLQKLCFFCGLRCAF